VLRKVFPEDPMSGICKFDKQAARQRNRLA
jgi:hypothetical protein